MELLELKNQLMAAADFCHSCEQGHKELSESDSASEFIRLLRQNWTYIYEGAFSQVIQENLIQWYQQWNKEFNAQHVYVNEPANRGAVFLLNYDGLFVAHNITRVYALSTVDCICKDYSHIVCRSANSKVELQDNSSGCIYKGDAFITDYAKAECHDRAFCFDNSTVTMFHGHLYDRGHKVIEAFNDACVHSYTDYHVNLHDRAMIVDGF